MALMAAYGLDFQNWAFQKSLSRPGWIACPILNSLAQSAGSSGTSMVGFSNTSHDFFLKVEIV